MSRAAEILEEAQAAEKKAASFSSYMQTDAYKKLRETNNPLWKNILELSGTYRQLSKLLQQRAEIEGATD